MEKLEKVIEEFLKRTAKECMKVVVVEGEPGILDDKLGGRPYLPVGEEYPLDKDGKPMYLVAQFNLKNVDLEGWPKTGIIEIFIDADLGWPCQYKIKYFEEGLEYQEELPKVEMEYPIIETPVKIVLEKATSIMPFSEHRFIDTVAEIIKDLYGETATNYPEMDSFFGTDDWPEPFIDKIENPRCNIGGYADFTQSDPRDREHTEKKECLFKLDSNLDFNNINIGDAGILFTFISKEDIKNARFENAVVDWDCC
ncbi:MAG: DUF1963 domain-containing protein [Clostridia bacterium]|nr:DUF1963 domain-containing protein [Clostridia bacterium]